jgi:PAS domain S-box-containing protein
MALLVGTTAGDAWSVEACNKAWSETLAGCLGGDLEAVADALKLADDGRTALRARVQSARQTPRRFSVTRLAAEAAVASYDLTVVPWPAGSAAPARGCLLVVHEHDPVTAAALRESEDKFSKAFRASPGAMAISELRTGLLMEVNDGYTEVFGYSRRELLGRSPEELGLWDDLADQRRFVTQLREAGSVRDFLALGRTKKGDLITCVVNAELADLGGVPCLVSSLRDVTEQRRVEQERAALEARLRQVQKLEALGTLAGGIAHDFNNILTTVLSCVDLALLDLGEPELLREHLRDIGRASERARDLVKQILTFSRRQPSARVGLHLAPVLEEVAAALRAVLPRGVELEVELDGKSPSVLGDATQLHRVFLNLGTNAVQAMAGREGRIAVRLASVGVDAAQAAAQPELKPGRYARVVVEDEGHGMSEEIQKRIFDPFFTTREHGGMGLGLAVVHGIVRDHDGSVTVHSELGKGTRFEVFFPEHTTRVTPLAVPLSSERRPRGAGQHVLLVDDEPIVCRSLRAILERLNYRVEAFTDPGLALKAFEAQPSSYDLVLTDLTMPGLGGVELARAVLAARPGTPVVLMSGFSVTWTPSRIRALGLRDLLWKPITLDELSAAVERALAPLPGRAIVPPTD